MNPHPDLNRFTILMRIFFILSFLLFSAIAVFFLSPAPGQTQAIPFQIYIFLAGLILMAIILFLQDKQLKTIFTREQDIRQALTDSEKKYKSIVDNIQIGFARATPGEQGQYIEVNSFLAKMLGYSRAELIQMPVAELYEDKKKRKAFSEQMCREDRVKAKHLVLCKKDGSVITVSVTGLAIRDDNDKVIFFDLIIEDITREVFHNDESFKKEKLSSIGVLAGGIAHDFNNILTGIYGNIALAKLELDPGSETAGLIDDAEKSLSLATDLTQQLLIFAKGGDPIKENLPIQQTVKEAAKFNLAGSNIKLETHFNDQLNSVNADKKQIHQVISNLVVNARHAMPDGGVLTIVGTNADLEKNKVATLEKGSYVKISVQDQGTGIPENCISKIFDPYFTTKPTGAGMGLATSFSIIRKHQGWITVSSEPDSGSVFNIYLPGSSPEQEQSQTEKTPVLTKIKSANILIMDDDIPVSTIARKMITKFGFQCEVVHDGEQAVNAYESAISNGSGYDLVLMDLTIPGGMGAKEAVTRLLDIDPHTKAVVTSGYSNDPVMASFQDYGFKGMVVKPFTIEELLSTIERVLNTA